jgi:hypothetical protein
MCRRRSASEQLPARAALHEYRQIDQIEREIYPEMD